MSSKVVQLDLFAKEKEVEQREFNRMTTKSLRGLFARYNELEFGFLEMHKRLDILSEAVFKNG